MHWKFENLKKNQLFHKSFCSNIAWKLVIQFATHNFKIWVQIWSRLHAWSTYRHVWYIISTRILVRSQKGIIHDCRLSVHWAMAMIVLDFGGQLVHLDMATWFWTSSPGRPGFESGHGVKMNWPPIFRSESILSDKGKIRKFHLETGMGIKFEKINS